MGTSVTATLDHRFLSEDGWKLIAQDFVKTGMLLDTINQVVSNQTVGLSEFGAELRKREITYETVKERIAQDKDLAAMLNSPAYTDEQKKAITNGITQQVMVELGYKPIENVLIATTEPGRDGYQIKGFFSLETGKAYINDFYNNSNADLLKTAGTETQRAIDAQEGSKFDQSKEYRDARSAYSQNFGSNIASYADFALYFTGQGSLSTGSNSISTSSQTLANNAEFKGLNKELGDNLTKVYIWKGYRYGESAFGHVSASIDDTSYSFGPNGMDIKPVEKYINRQKEIRSGLAIEIPLSAAEEKQFENYLKSYDGKYWLNYCASPINQGLQSLGYQFDSQIIPMSFYMELMRSNIGKNPTVIEQNK